MKQVDLHQLPFDSLMSFGSTALTGLLAQGATLKVLQNTAEAVRTDVEAARNNQSDYQASITRHSEAVAAKNATAKDVAAYISRAREVLKRKLGARYSRVWSEAGFLSPTLQLKRTLDVQQSVLKSLELYFTAHPEAEVVDWDVTAAFAKTLYDTSVERVGAANVAEVTRRELRTSRDGAVKALRDRLRHLFHELKQLMSDNDPRWLEFGFNVPGDKTTPAAPEGLTVTPGDAGKASLNWDHTVNTSKFNIWQEVVGVDAEPVKIGSAMGTSKELSGLPAGAHVRFYVTAVNSVGESVPSAVVEIVVP